MFSPAEEGHAVGEARVHAAGEAAASKETEHDDKVPKEPAANDPLREADNSADERARSEGAQEGAAGGDAGRAVGAASPAVVPAASAKEAEAPASRNGAYLD